METTENQFTTTNDNNLSLNNSTNDQVPTKTNDETLNVTAENNLYPAPNDNIYYKLTPEQGWTSATVLSRAGNATGKNKAWFNIYPDNCNPLSISLDTLSQWQLSPYEAKVIIVRKSQHSNKSVINVKQIELENWKSFHIFSEVPHEGLLVKKNLKIFCKIHISI